MELVATYVRGDQIHTLYETDIGYVSTSLGEGGEGSSPLEMTGSKPAIMNQDEALVSFFGQACQQIMGIDEKMKAKWEEEHKKKGEADASD